MSEDELREFAKHRFVVTAVDAVAALNAKDEQIAELRKEIARLEDALWQATKGGEWHRRVISHQTLSFRDGLSQRDDEIARLREVAATTSLPKDLFEIARLRAALDAIDHGAASAAKTPVCADCGLRSATVKDGLCYRCTPTSYGAAP